MWDRYINCHPFYSGTSWKNYHVFSNHAREWNSASHNQANYALQSFIYDLPWEKNLKVFIFQLQDFGETKLIPISVQINKYTIILRAWIHVPFGCGWLVNMKEYSCDTVFRTDSYALNYELVVTTMEGLDKSSNSPSLLNRALSFLNHVFTCRASTCSLVLRWSKLLRISAYLVRSLRSGLGFSSYHFLSSGISIVELKTIFFPRRVASIFFPGEGDPSSSCSLLSWECSYHAAKSLIFSDDKRQGYWSLDIWDSMPC